MSRPKVSIPKAAAESAAAPAAVEAISYSLPAFKYRGRPLVSYGAAKNHCAFYVMSPEVMEAHKDELEGPPDRAGIASCTSDGFDATRRCWPKAAETCADQSLPARIRHQNDD